MTAAENQGEGWNELGLNSKNDSIRLDLKDSSRVE